MTLIEVGFECIDDFLAMQRANHWTYQLGLLIRMCPQVAQR
ncbi:MAG: hypothetical protein AAGD11_02745 [Planctomycetota bacterium]